MKTVTHPRMQDLELAKVFQALSDPTRLRLVRMLAAEKDLSCSVLCLGRPKSSMSHHFKIMIDAGLLRVDVAGNTHRNNLRLNDLESRFPGLMTLVLQSADKAGGVQVQSPNVPEKVPVEQRTVAPSASLGRP